MDQEGRRARAAPRGGDRVPGPAASPARQRTGEATSRLLRGPVDVATLKREQSRINAEAAEAESQIAVDGENLAQAKQIIDLALVLAKDCPASYRKAGPEVRKMWNRAYFQRIHVRGGGIQDFTYEKPFASLLGSNKESIVDLAGRCVNRRSLLAALRRQASR